MTRLIDSTQETLLRRFVEGNVNDLEKEQVRAILKKVVDGSLSEQEEKERIANEQAAAAAPAQLDHAIAAEQAEGRDRPSTPPLAGGHGERR